MALRRIGIPDGIARGITGGAWAATVLLALLDDRVAEPPSCGGNAFASSAFANDAMGALLVVMVAGSLIALPATTVALILGRRRGDDRLGKIGRNTLLAALVLLPVAFFVLVGTLFRGVCFSF